MSEPSVVRSKVSESENTYEITTPKEQTKKNKTQRDPKPKVIEIKPDEIPDEKIKKQIEETHSVAPSLASQIKPKKERSEKQKAAWQKLIERNKERFQKYNKNLEEEEEKREQDRLKKLEEEGKIIVKVREKRTQIRTKEHPLRAVKKNEMCVEVENEPLVEKKKDNLNPPPLVRKNANPTEPSVSVSLYSKLFKRW